MRRRENGIELSAEDTMHMALLGGLGMMSYALNGEVPSATLVEAYTCVVGWAALIVEALPDDVAGEELFDRLGAAERHLTELRGMVHGPLGSALRSVEDEEGGPWQP